MTLALQVGGFYVTRDGNSVMISEQCFFINEPTKPYFRGVFTDGSNLPTWWYPDGRQFRAVESGRDLVREA